MVKHRQRAAAAPATEDDFFVLELVPAVAEDAA